MVREEFVALMEAKFRAFGQVVAFYGTHKQSKTKLYKVWRYEGSLH